MKIMVVVDECGTRMDYTFEIDPATPWGKDDNGFFSLTHTAGQAWWHKDAIRAIYLWYKDQG